MDFRECDTFDACGNLGESNRKNAKCHMHRNDGDNGHHQILWIKLQLSRTMDMCSLVAIRKRNLKEALADDVTACW